MYDACSMASIQNDVCLGGCEATVEMSYLVGTYSHANSLRISVYTNIISLVCIQRSVGRIFLAQTKCCSYILNGDTVNVLLFCTNQDFKKNNLRISTTTYGGYHAHRKLQLFQPFIHRPLCFIDG